MNNKDFEAMHLKIIESLKKPQTLSLGWQLENWAAQQGEKTMIWWSLYQLRTV